MSKMELTLQSEQPLTLPGDVSQAVAQTAQAVAQMAQAMRGMADMVRATNERMAALEQQVRLLTKVTPAQASEINARIRTRAAELCESYHCIGSEKAAVAAIRRDMKLTQGVQSMRDLPRCEYKVALHQVALWDDYKIMKGIARKEKSR